MRGKRRENEGDMNGKEMEMQEHAGDRKRKTKGNERETKGN